MQPTIEDTLTEVGRLYMETVTLRRALGDQQHEAARMATEVGSLRKNVVALNERLMGRAAPREVEHSQTA